MPRSLIIYLVNVDGSSLLSSGEMLCAPGHQIDINENDNAENNIIKLYKYINNNIKKRMLIFQGEIAWNLFDPMCK